MLKFLRNHWYHMTLLFFIGMFFWILFFDKNINYIERLLLASLMALPIHQFEEYELPGGGPIVINRVFWGEKERYLNYPGNWNSIMIVNLSAYIFYILAIVFPNCIWLGLSTMLFNLFQVLGHCLEMNIKGKTLYNPGMISSIVLFIPISVAYIVYVFPCLDGVTWFLSVVFLIFMLLVSVILPVQLLKNKNSKYVIPDWQNEQYEKIANRFHI